PTRIPGPVCQSDGFYEVEDGTTCRMPSPCAGTVGRFYEDIPSWPLERKLLEAAKRTTNKLPAEMRSQFASLFSAQNIAITTGVLGAWGAAHFFGVGEAADVILVGVGAFFLGRQVIQVTEDLYQFVTIAAKAKNEQDLDRA